MNRSLILFASVLVPFAIGCSKPKTKVDEKPVQTETKKQAPEPTERIHADVVIPAKADMAPEVRDVAPVPHELGKPIAPTSTDWDPVEPLAIKHKGCEAKRLGDWVRVKCPDTTGGIQALAGDARGVVFGCWNASAEASCVVFPMQPGDKRVFQFTDIMFFGGGWGGGGATTDQKAMVSAWWPKKAIEPKITVD